MKTKKVVFLVPLCAALLVATGTIAHAAEGVMDGGCTRPIYHPTPTFPSLCDIVPELCTDDEPPIATTMGDALVDMGQQLWLVQKGVLPPASANQRIKAVADKALSTLQVGSAARSQALAAITAADHQYLSGVASHAVSVGALMEILGDAFLGAAGTSEEAQASAQGGTVTTTTTGGFEINLGIFKITVSQTVTTVETTGETTGGDDDTGGDTGGGDTGVCEE